MVIASITIAVITMLYLLVNYKNKFVYILGMYFLSMAYLMLVSVLYISKTSMYVFPFQPDYDIYIALSKIRVHIWDIATMYNVGMALFMISPIVLCKMFRRYKWWVMAALMLPALLFVTLNSPFMTVKLYIRLNRSANGLVSWYCTNRTFINNAIFWFYIIFPVAFLLMHLKNTKIRIRRRDTVVFLCCISTIDLFIFLTFITGPLKSVNYNNTSLLKFPAGTVGSAGYFVAPAACMLLLIVVITAMLYFKPFDNNVMLQKREFVKNTNLLNKNLNMVLHTYKNSFIGINHLVDIIMDSAEKDSRTQKSAEIIKGIADDNIEKIAKTLGMIKNTGVSCRPLNVAQCVNEVIKKVMTGSGVKTVINAGSGEIYIYADRSHICEAIVNVVENALWAIDVKKTENPQITVSIEKEDEYCIVEIKDNGCGIKNEDIKHIFKPFYSSKPKSMSGGIGLTYVKNVMNLHKGDVEVRSTPGEGTAVTLVLPLFKYKNEKQVKA